jgi:prepilin-type N-terminal cleavage/methylation domain-containing protein
MFNRNTTGREARTSGIRGFTLIEIIVSLGIFAVVSVVAVGALLKVIDANKKAQALKTAINNLNFALESMSREIRTGSEYEPDDVNVSGHYDELTFRTSKSCDGNPVSASNYLYVSYKYNSASKTIEKASGCEGSSELNEYDPIVSTDLTVTYMEFDVDGVEFPIDTRETQPIVRITLQGHSGVRERDKSYFSLQTTVSQRLMPF